MLGVLSLLDSIDEACQRNASGTEEIKEMLRGLGTQLTSVGY